MTEITPEVLTDVAKFLDKSEHESTAKIVRQVAAELRLRRDIATKYARVFYDASNSEYTITWDKIDSVSRDFYLKGIMAVLEAYDKETSPLIHIAPQVTPQETKVQVREDVIVANASEKDTGPWDDLDDVPLHIDCVYDVDGDAVTRDSFTPTTWHWDAYDHIHHHKHNTPEHAPYYLTMEEADEPW